MISLDDCQSGADIALSTKDLEKAGFYVRHATCFRCLMAEAEVRCCRSRKWVLWIPSYWNLKNWRGLSHRKSDLRSVFHLFS